MSSAGFSITGTLPVPTDDGACDHLSDIRLPSIILPSTSSATVDLSSLRGLNILFTYPRTGAPGEDIPAEWDAIPGARGCSPQACSFRDAMTDLRAHGVQAIYGISTQDSAYQHEAQTRLKLSYDLLSDEKLEFARAMNFPTFEWQGRTLLKRSVLVVEDGVVRKVFHPVFPSDASASLALAWVKTR